MRLTKIKLAGFKSFVEPTTIEFPSNLVGVVGPNGCGKSNVIDAVRWVMGESSASRLRGDSITDVIFNGSSARKPVGTASIELLFDNSDATVAGQYAGYNEISVRRTVSRDAISTYYLNGTKCRRKDITQIFLGTGLGPRSYSIIEQGMISRLIEAKPEDMRVFIEEAAGISKYKERRRETENRIKHTRENLERLTDLLEEVEAQLRRLGRQAKAAERYKSLKNDERRTQAELLALRIGELQGVAEQQERDLAERENQVEAAIADQRKAEASIAETRERLTETSEVFNDAQAKFYKIGGEIGRLEQSIEHNRQMRERRAADLKQAESGVAEILAHIEQDSTALQQLNLTLDQLTPDLESSKAQAEASMESLRRAEAQMQDWQEGWDAFNARAGAAERAVQVEQARVEQYDAQIERLTKRRALVSEQREALPVAALKDEAVRLAASARERQAEAEQGEAALADSEQAVRRAASEIDGMRHEMDHLRTSISEQQGRAASLEALQQAALEQSEGGVSDWLDQRSLAGAQRVAQRLRVKGGWTGAVEAVLGDWLQSVCVDDAGGLSAELSQLEGNLALVSASGVSRSSGEGSLAQHVEQAPPAIVDLLSRVRCVENDEDALRMRDRLGDGESVISQSGLWMGTGWARVAHGEDAASGTLGREQELRDLRHSLSALRKELESLEGRLSAHRETFVALEAKRDESRQAASQFARAAAQSAVEAAAAEDRVAEAAVQLQKIDVELGEIGTETQRVEEAITNSRRALAENSALLEGVGEERDKMQAQREQLRQDLDVARSRSAEDRESAQSLALRFESRRSSRESAEQSLQRMQSQLGQFQQRQQQLQQEMDNAVAPVADMEANLATLLEQRVQADQALGKAREHVENTESQLRELEQQRSDFEERVSAARDALSEMRVGQQENKVRLEGVHEQFAELQFELEEVTQSLDESADTSEWSERLTTIARKIDRLGPINLAAIDEQKEQQERKEYLDSQLQDLNSALTTLENAIRKIDRETRNRFKETYDRVNSGFQRLFPQLFGGGQAYLELTGDDLLAAGVTVMARPPGKRNSTIHLLSGGEKALTAVALVFAIFELNPAPFCMLDEVDAPLDDANVGRFCQIVKAMSETVQFVFISHNKATMEMAQQLMGVTMNEPGVSRLVAVDLDEAVKMATA
ncbi:MAG: chromosome segregation protein SMC [Pseudomonadota bacterium]